MQSQINRTISSAINHRVIPEIQNIVGNFPLNQNGFEPNTSLTEDCIGNACKNTNSNFTKKDLSSACDLREDAVFVLTLTIAHSFEDNVRCGWYSASNSTVRVGASLLGIVKICSILLLNTELPKRSINSKIH